MAFVKKFILTTKMDSALNADNREQLQVEENYDSHRVEFVEIVPLVTDTVTTEYVSGDWFGSVKEVDLAVLKQESHDVCCFIYVTYNFS